MIWRPSIVHFFASRDAGEYDEMRNKVKNISEPTAKMWFEAEALLLLLRTLHEVQVVTTSDPARTVPFVVHCLVVIKDQMSQENVLDGLIKQYWLVHGFDATEISRDLEILQASVLESIRTSFDPLLSEMMWCSLLDPHYAKMEHLSEREQQQCELALIEEAVGLYREETTPAPDNTQIEETRQRVTDEVAAYLDGHKGNTRMTDSFKWWRDNQMQFPFLSKLARVWLGAIGCSSAAIGRLQRDIPYEVSYDNEIYAGSEDVHESNINMLYLHVKLRDPKPKQQTARDSAF